MAQAQFLEPSDRADDKKTTAIQIVSTQTQDGELRVNFQQAEHIGKRKKEQQDAHGHLQWTAQPARGQAAGYLFVVADGVSMGQAGALASRTAVDVMLASFQKQLDEGQSDYSIALSNAFIAANNEVYDLSRTRPGMATTCVAALLTGQTLITCHVGDSRAYLYRPNLHLMPVTVDHSWLAELGELLVQQGIMTRQEMLRDQRRHTITRAFGLQRDLAGDINAAQLLPGDLVILCSDGLWDVLPPGFLEDSTKENLDLPVLSQKLVDAAMEAGGRDNITVTLARLESPGAPVKLPGLDAMLERTAKEVAERTRPIQVDNPNRQKTAAEKIPASSGRSYQPMGVVDLPDENSFVDDPPSLKVIPPPNLEMMLSKAQKSFALGDWNAAIDQFIEIELIEASFSGLYESFSNSLVRFVGVAVGQSHMDEVTRLLKRLEDYNITRYHEMLADYCNDEGKRAVNVRHYAAARSYAQVSLRLRPNDVRAKTLLELCELYLELKRPQAPLSERLSLGQKIYARDENFGGIQDDLARIYLEMGDEATRYNALEDAAGWYSMVLPLRPDDKQVLALASNRQRSAEEELARRARNSKTNFGLSESLPPASSPTNGPGSPVKPGQGQPNRGGENRAELDQINRLKERVSRAQKAWDSGRKEVGGEYIYLVDQLGELVTTHPWQTTFPRVCYDYAKWLLDQKQYAEARPYFQKAHQLGMAAAQQRLNEIDRILRERQPAPRNNGANDLLDNPFDLLSADPTQPAEKPKPLNTAGLFTSRRSSSTPIRQVVSPKMEPESAGTPGLGTSPKGARNAGPIPNPNNNNSDSLPPRSAAAVAAGNWNKLDSEESQPLIKPVDNGAGPAQVSSGTLRQTAPFANDPVQRSANREAERLSATGFPQSLDPRLAAQRRLAGFAHLFQTRIGPVVVGIIVVVGLILIGIVVISNFSKNSAQPTPAAATSPAITSDADTTPTVVVGGGLQGTVRIEGPKPETLQVFLAEDGNPTSPYRELGLEGAVFKLPTASLNKLDPRQKYLIVVRPKDTPDRTYAGNLQPDNPAQQPFTSPTFAFDPANGFDLTIKISAEALAFYPLQGTTDQTLPTGRYFGATQHSVRGDYLKFYDANGGLGRFGFPISEEFDWTGNGHVQFFERGWLAVAATGQPVTIGKVGKMLLESNCSTITRLPASVTPLAVPTLKPDPDFDKVATNLKLGPVQSQPFEVNGVNRLKVQYFELGRLELNLADKKAAPTLGRLGAEYATCVGWLK